MLRSQPQHLHKMSNPSKNELPESFVRLAKSWVTLPFVAYLFAIPCLGAGALFVPVVVAKAPLGVISYFDEVTLDDHQHQTELVVLHLVFWTLLVVGLMGRRRLPLWGLRAVWALLVILLFMSVSGCAREFGAGLRSSGNWH